MINLILPFVFKRLSFILVKYYGISHFHLIFCELPNGGTTNIEFLINKELSLISIIMEQNTYYFWI
jgi:hypothetical protein